MNFIKFFYMCSFFLCISTVVYADASIEKIPKNFVYLKNIDPSILQDIRYYSDHNFVGHPIPGYQTSTCILTRQAAMQLKKIQSKLKPLGYSLKVYDCYRPQQAVDAFVAWSEDATQATKAEFYPDLNKEFLFDLDYIAKKSGHTRGSTIDLTLVALPAKSQTIYSRKNLQVACFAPYGKRFQDNSIDMGTGFDCFSTLSHPNNVTISSIAYLNRMLLRYWMEKYNFVGLETEWWHFTLKNEPYPDTYFNFPVQ